MSRRIRDIAELNFDAEDLTSLWHILLITLVFKALIAAILPLGVDEAYAIAVAREYSISFFDHPPLSFWAPVAMADLTGLEHPLIFRLPFLAAGLITTGLIYLIGRAIGGPRAGLWTALLYTAAPFFLTSGGFMVLPDGFLNLGLAAAVLWLVKIVQTDGKPPLHYWIWTGLALAFALASKYQAAWLPVAVILFMLASPKGRQWFLQPGPWLAGMIGLLGLLPVVLWNIQNDWSSLAFHGSRAGGGLSPRNLGWMLVAQSLFLLPPFLIGSVVGLWQALHRPGYHPAFLLALVALGPILIFNAIYLTSSSSLAHWTMPGWLFALPLAGGWLAARPRKSTRRFLGWGLGFALLIWLPLLSYVVQSQTGVLTRYSHQTPPEWDQTQDVFDYGGLQNALQQRGLWQQTDLFLTANWSSGGVLDTALGSQKPMRILPGNAAHHFAYLSDAQATGEALYLEATRLKHGPAIEARLLAEAQNLDPGAELLPAILLDRAGQPYIYVALVRLRLE